jgi:ribosomal protein L37AE/L43A
MTNLEKATQIGEKQEFSIRSCWDCNGSHEHLKNVSGLFTCFSCGRWYMNGGFMDDDKHRESEYKELSPLQTVKITISKD